MFPDTCKIALRLAAMTFRSMNPFVSSTNARGPHRNVKKNRCEISPPLGISSRFSSQNSSDLVVRLKSASSVPLTTLARSNVASAACPKSAIAASSFSYASSSFSSELFLLSSPSSSPRSNDDEIANASRHQSAEGPIKKLLFCLSNATGIEISVVFRERRKDDHFERNDRATPSRRRVVVVVRGFFFDDDAVLSSLSSSRNNNARMGEGISIGGSWCTQSTKERPSKE
mmetsp:Transcript_5937/g.17471  ORF Transcript_5937/g.17471 Transcript_5937/m.17471 type:complete len:229 (+) Transcript_5937:4034-4720(+)